MSLVKYSIRFGNRTEPKSGWGLYRREMDESSFRLKWLIQGWKKALSDLDLRSPKCLMIEGDNSTSGQLKLLSSSESSLSWHRHALNSPCSMPPPKPPHTHGSQLTELHTSSQATSYTHGSQLTVLRASSQATSLSPTSKSLVLAAWRMKKYIAFLGRKLILKVIKDD